MTSELYDRESNPGNYINSTTYIEEVKHFDLYSLINYYCDKNYAKVIEIKDIFSEEPTSFEIQKYIALGCHLQEITRNTERLENLLTDLAGKCCRAQEQVRAIERHHDGEVCSFKSKLNNLVQRMERQVENWENFSNVLIERERSRKRADLARERKEELSKRVKTWTTELLKEAEKL